jgi:hypothetical protein
MRQFLEYNEVFQGALWSTAERSVIIQRIQVSSNEILKYFVYRSLEIICYISSTSLDASLSLNRKTKVWSKQLKANHSFL